MTPRELEFEVARLAVIRLEKPHDDDWADLLLNGDVRFCYGACADHVEVEARRDGFVYCWTVVTTEIRDARGLVTGLHYGVVNLGWHREPPR